MTEAMKFLVWLSQMFFLGCGIIGFLIFVEGVDRRDR